MSKKFHGIKIGRVKRGRYRYIREFDRKNHEEDVLYNRHLDREEGKFWPNRFRYRTFWLSHDKFVGESRKLK